MKEIIKQNNIMLASRLIPKGNEPICGNSFTNPKDEVFQKPINHAK